MVPFTIQKIINFPSFCEILCFLCICSLSEHLAFKQFFAVIRMANFYWNSPIIQSRLNVCFIDIITYKYYNSNAKLKDSSSYSPRSQNTNIPALYLTMGSVEFILFLLAKMHLSLFINPAIVNSVGNALSFLGPFSALTFIPGCYNCGVYLGPSFKRLFVIALWSSIRLIETS